MFKISFLCFNTKLSLSNHFANSFCVAMNDFFNSSNAICGRNRLPYRKQKYCYIIFCLSSVISFFILMIYIENFTIELRRFLFVNVINGATFSNDTELKFATFSNDTELKFATFSNDTELKFATFSNDTELKFATFSNDTELKFATFSNDTELKFGPDHTVCRVPKLNPWDPLIMNGVKHPKDLYCAQVQPFLTFIDDDGYLRINTTEQKRIHDNNKTFSCVYWTFDRSEETIDSRQSYDAEMNLTKPVKLSKDYVKVQCNYDNEVVTDDSEENQLYWNYHAHPSESRNKSHFAEPTEHQLSVIVYVVDSVSDSAMQRNLPLTLNYTSNVMGMKYFKALNKVGDNSFPNFMAMLMGKRVTDEQEDMPREMEGDYSKIQYDSWPLIWKLYSAKGYATVFNEDNPQVGLFHFDAKGFAKKPVDFYHHTFWSAVQTESNHDYICFRNEPKAKMIMDLTRRQIMTMKDKLQFLFTSTMELSHDYDNQVELSDDHLLRFWKSLYEGGYLNRSAIIFASDHGIRHGWIRTTQIGLLEERLPFFGLWFPEWFFDKHSHIKKNIESNLETLSSSYDVYETLIDILNANWNNGSQRNETHRGQSQLYPLPKSRTCNQAGIPDHYCTCAVESRLDLNDSLVHEGAQFFVQHINFLLQNLSDICHIVRLKKILFVTLVDVNEKVKQGIRNQQELAEFSAGMEVKNTKNYSKEIRFGIETHPHNALFDALLRKLTVGTVNTWTVVGTVSRTNKYRGLSDCIHDKLLRKFCSCKNVPVP